MDEGLPEPAERDPAQLREGPQLSNERFENLPAHGSGAIPPNPTDADGAVEIAEGSDLHVNAAQIGADGVESPSILRLLQHAFRPRLHAV